MKRRYTAAAAILLCSASIACADGNPFVGKWTAKEFFNRGIDFLTSWEHTHTYGVVFEKDLTFKFSGYDDGTITSGPYSFTEEELTIHETHEDGKPAETEEPWIMTGTYFFRDEDYFVLRLSEKNYLVFERFCCCCRE